MDKVLITTSSFGKEPPTSLDVLSKHGIEAIVNPYARKLTEEELHQLLSEHNPVGLIAGVEPITGKILNESNKFLRVISRVGVGWDNIDHHTAKKLGIKVYRTEGVLDQPVAELTLGFILNALRNISLHDRELRSCVWEKRMGSLLYGKTVGIIGYGAIGRKVGQLCAAFGANVVFSDICVRDSDCAICFPMEKLLGNADIITIHASGCDQIISKKELEICKPGVIIVNTARGGLVREKDLFEALKSGQVGCACLDVFENEPYSGPLMSLDNVILTTHIGSYAREARIKMEEMAVSNFLTGLNDTCAD